MKLSSKILVASVGTGLASAQTVAGAGCCKKWEIILNNGYTLDCLHHSGWSSTSKSGKWVYDCQAYGNDFASGGKTFDLTYVSWFNGGSWAVTNYESADSMAYLTYATDGGTENDCMTHHDQWANGAKSKCLEFYEAKAVAAPEFAFDLEKLSAFFDGGTTTREPEWATTLGPTTEATTSTIATTTQGTSQPVTTATNPSATTMGTTTTQGTAQPVTTATTRPAETTATPPDTTTVAEETTVVTTTTTTTVEPTTTTVYAGPTKPFALFLNFKFGMKITWDDNYADPTSPDYAVLEGAVVQWLQSTLDTVMTKYKLGLELEITLIAPTSRRRRRRRELGTDVAQLEAAIKFIGRTPVDQDLNDLGQNVANETTESINAAVAAYTGEHVDETTVAVGTEVDIADECDIRVSTTICESGRQGILVPICAFPQDRVSNPYMTHDDSCKGMVHPTDDTMWLFDTTQDNCTITPTYNGNKAIYNSMITWEEGVASGWISRISKITVDFECKLERTMRLSLDNDVTPMLEKIDVDLPSSSGSFQLSLGLYTNNTFTDPLPADAVISIPDNLYLGTNLIGSSTDRFVRMENCWATPSSNKDDGDRYDFVESGCADQDDIDYGLIEIVSNGEANSAMLTLESFQFQDQDAQIYLHCQVHVCDGDVSCAPSCDGSDDSDNSDGSDNGDTGSRRRRRDTPNSNTLSVKVSVKKYNPRESP